MNPLAKQSTADTSIQTKAASVRNLLEKSRSQIAAALPKHMTADRMIRVAMTSVQRVPKLLECDQISLVGAIIQASQLGLETDGVLGHAHLVPFKGKVQLIVGYKGLIELARRSGQVVSISAHVVYSNDDFTYEYGLNETLSHRPTMGDRGTPIAAYAVAKLKDGGHAFDVMSVNEINTIRDKSQGYRMAKQYGSSSPWDETWDEMAKKTVIRRLSKFLPMSIELQKASALDEAADQGIQAEFNKSYVPVEPTANMAAAMAPAAEKPEDTEPVAEKEESDGSLGATLAEIDKYEIQSGLMSAYVARAIGKNKSREEWTADDAAAILADIRRVKGAK